MPEQDQQLSEHRPSPPPPVSTARPAGVPLGLKLFLFFIVLPIVELFLLAWLASATSFLFTLGLVILSALAGAEIARRQGLAAWLEAQREMALGRFPADSMLDAMLILFGGALLIIPGILTTLAGITTLIPPVRAFYRRRVKSSFKLRVNTAGAGGTSGGGFQFYTFGGGAPPQPPAEEETPSPAQPPAGNPFEDRSPFGKIKDGD